MYLSVIIPAYNEEKRIGSTLLSVKHYLSKQDYTSEVIVVNDGSKDKTVEVAKAELVEVPHHRIIDNHKNHGKGWVVRQGILEAKGKYRLFMDADNSTTIDQVEKFLPRFEEGYDVVVGSRRARGAIIAVRQPWFRDFLGGVFRLIVHILVPLRGVSDSQAGFKVFSAEAAEKVFPKQTVFRWAFDVEILTLARKAQFKITEVPIVWQNDTESRVKLKGMIAMLFEVLTIRFNLWFGKYKFSKITSKIS